MRSELGAVTPAAAADTCAVDLAQRGCCVVPDAIDAVACAALLTVTDTLACGAGSRTLLEHPLIAQLARDLRRHPRIAAYLTPNSVAMQCTYFNKSAQTNWGVGWHQDTVMPLHAAEGDSRFRMRSTKQGVSYAQAPAAILETMLAVRVHLDYSDADNGPLRVLPGSHTHGVLSEAQCAQLSAQTEQVQCLVARGGALLLRPLLLHASSKAASAGARRVLHFVYASPLTQGARWLWQV